MVVKVSSKSISGERGMNPVAMTIINPWKEYWPTRRSNQRPPVLKSATLLTELWYTAQKVSTHVSLRSPLRQTWVSLVANFSQCPNASVPFDSVCS